MRAETRSHCSQSTYVSKHRFPAMESHAHHFLHCYKLKIHPYYNHDSLLSFLSNRLWAKHSSSWHEPPPEPTSALAKFWKSRPPLSIWACRPSYSTMSCRLDSSALWGSCSVTRSDCVTAPLSFWISSDRGPLLVRDSSRYAVELRA